MTQLGNNAVTRAAQKRHQVWLERLPQLENNEAKLLNLIGEIYNRFLAGEKDIRSLAVEFGVPTDIAVQWARDGKWLARRDEFRQELLVNVEMEYAEFVREKRVATAQELVDKLLPKVSAIADAIGDAVASDDSVAVRRYAEALAQISGIVTKAVGLDAPMPQSDRQMAAREQDPGAPAGKQPFFNINTKGPVQISQGPSQPAEEEKPAIDI